jgi:PAS domain S-box-containing protein
VPAKSPKIGRLPAYEVVAETPEISALLKSAVDEVARLLRADGAMLYLVGDESGEMRLAHQAGIRDERHRTMLDRLRVHVGEGLFGKAVAEGAPVLTGDYPRDRGFVHARGSDRFVRDIGLRSMVVAPLVHEGASYGGLGAFSARRDAFSDPDRALVRALADHAAASIANTLLIERLATSEREIAHRAEIERALREIGSRLAAIRDPADLLQRVVDESARLLGADGARIELLDEATGRLHWAYDSRTGRKPGMGPIAEDTSGPEGGTRDEGVSGLAFRENRAVSTDDYLADDQFLHLPGADAQVARYGIRSAVSVPLAGEQGPVGTLTVYSSDRHAYDPDDVAVVVALADQAGVVLVNARRMADLERSREENARRADSEHALREIATRISAITDPSVVLERILKEAVRLVGGDGGQLDLVATIGGARQWVFPPADERYPIVGVQLDPPYSGISGRSIEEGRGVATGDYLRDRSFRHLAAVDRTIRRLGIQSVIAAPLMTGATLVGCLQVGSRRKHAFDEDHIGLIEALATHASIAIANADRLDALARSREENARLADSERSLRQIAARITAIRDPSEVLEQIVGEAARLLAAERAQIDLMTPIDGRLQWPYPASKDRPTITAAGIPTPRGDQIRGLAGRAIQEGRIVATGDYLADRSFRHVAATDKHVRRDGLRSVVAAPLVSEGDGLGVLQIATVRPDAFGEGELTLIEALATQASIAIANSRRTADLARSRTDLARRAASEQALRELATRLTAIREPADVLQHTVDEAVRVLGADAALIDLLEADKQLIGAYDSGLTGVIDDRSLREQTIRAGEGLSGRAIAERRALRTADYLADASFAHTAHSDRFVGHARLHSMIAAPLLAEDRAFGALEVFARAVDAFDEDAVATAAALASQASVAITNARLFHDLDTSRRELEDLLERVRDSESRYRFLMESSPDIVFSMAADGRITFMSDSVERITGWTPGEVIGRLFADFVAPDEMPLAARLFVEQSADPSVPLTAEIGILGRDGQRIPLELNSQAHVHDGRVESFHGVAREIGERLRFERELRDHAAALAASEERAHLARELHDSVTQALFSMTLVTRSLELLLDRDRAAALEKLQDLRALQRDALAEMRALVFELRPDSLARDGLAHALRTHAAAVEARMGLPIVVDVTSLERMPAPIEQALYRIAQESLHNVVKHAAATRAQIMVATSDGHCLMVTSDDGRGFDPGAVPPGHMGLAGMLARAQRLGGSLSIDSRPGAGTRIRVEVPLEASGQRPSN